MSRKESRVYQLGSKVVELVPDGDWYLIKDVPSVNRVYPKKGVEITGRNVPKIKAAVDAHALSHHRVKGGVSYLVSNKRTQESFGETEVFEDFNYEPLVEFVKKRMGKEKVSISVS